MNHADSALQSHLFNALQTIELLISGFWVRVPAGSQNKGKTHSKSGFFVAKWLYAENQQVLKTALLTLELVARTIFGVRCGQLVRRKNGIIPRCYK